MTSKTHVLNEFVIQANSSSRIPNFSYRQFTNRYNYVKCLRNIFPAWPLYNNDLKAEALIYGFLDIFECKLENTIGCSHLITNIVHVEIHNVFVLKRTTD